MKISVIILSYNRVNDTIKLLASLEKQNYKNFEIILVDNNSTDDTIKQVKKSYSDVNCVELKHNIGVPGGRNEGIKNACGEYLVFIDNDAEVGPLFLERINSTFTKETRAGILAFRITNYYTKEIDMTTWVWGKTLLFTEDLTPVHKFVGAGFAIRKAVVDLIGLMWEDLFFMHEEKDFCMRLLRTDFLVYYSPDIEVYHKVSPEKRYESNERSYYYGIRNDFWIYIRNAPIYKAMIYLTYLCISALPYSIKKKSFGYYLKGIVEGIFLSKNAIKLRKPLTTSQFSKFVELEAREKESFKFRIIQFLTE
jgi:GT2 family glycosyltransferase